MLADTGDAMRIRASGYQFPCLVDEAGLVRFVMHIFYEEDRFVEMYTQ